MKKIVVFLCCSLVASLAHAQATLEAPSEDFPGATVDVAWTGPGANNDPVKVVKAGAPDAANAMTAAKIVSSKNSNAVLMPDEPGDFELRYVSFPDKHILAPRPIVPTTAAF